MNINKIIMRHFCNICMVLLFPSLLLMGCSKSQESISYDYAGICKQIAVELLNDQSTTEIFEEPLAFRETLVGCQRKQFDREFADTLAVSVMTQYLLFILDRVTQFGDFSPTLLSGLVKYELSIVEILPDVFKEPYAKAFYTRMSSDSKNYSFNDDIRATAVILLEQPSNALHIIEPINKEYFPLLANEIVSCNVENSKEIIGEFSPGYFANTLAMLIYNLQDVPMGMDLCSYLQKPIIDFLAEEDY